MKQSKYIFPTAALLAALLASCGEEGFKISGTVDGADDASVILEKADFNGNWIALDSTRTSGSGAFGFESPRPSAPEIFRLSLNGGKDYIYLPVDSTEHIDIRTKASDFAGAYTVSGSRNAERMAAFEKDLRRHLPYAAVSDSADTFKRRVYAEYLMNAGGNIVSYYVLTKTVGDRPLFDPADATDYKYLTAVATSFKTYRPDDPRTRLLEQTAIEAMRQRNSARGKQRYLEARELRYIDLTLPDEHGKEISLSSVVGKGKPSILAFVALTSQGAPEENRTLAGSGAAVYMIGLDSDVTAWREAAVNLPWTTVYDAAGPASDAAVKYNVGEIPTYFVFDAAGNLVSRAATAAEAVRKAR